MHQPAPYRPCSPVRMDGRRLRLLSMAILVAVALLSGSASQRLARLIGLQQEAGSVIGLTGSQQQAREGGIDRQAAAPQPAILQPAPAALPQLRAAVHVRLPALQRHAAGMGRRPRPLEIEAAEMAGDVHRLADHMQAGHGLGLHGLR